MQQVRITFRTEGLSEEEIREVLRRAFGVTAPMVTPTEIAVTLPEELRARRLNAVHVWIAPFCKG